MCTRTATQSLPSGPHHAIPCRPNCQFSLDPFLAVKTTFFPRPPHKCNSHHSQTSEFARHCRDTTTVSGIIQHPRHQKTNRRIPRRVIHLPTFYSFFCILELTNSGSLVSYLEHRSRQLMDITTFSPVCQRNRRY
jgi:hypothetical protein